MSPTVAEIVKRLDEAIPLAKAAAWDAVGLQVGDPAAPAGSIAVCHEVTPEVVAAAQDAAIDLLVGYHPLLFNRVDAFVAGSSEVGRAFELARAGIALYVVHTAFDVVAGGCADALAATLNLQDVAGFGPNWPRDTAKVVTFVPEEHAAAVTAAMAQAGAGQVGGYTECSFAVAGTGTYRPGELTSPFAGESGALSHEQELRVEMAVPASRIDAVVATLVASHPYDEPAFDVYEDRANAGFVGRVGNVPATSLGELGDVVASALDAAVRMAGDPATDVERVAVVPGSGSSLFAAAATAGAQAVLTGDVSHHRAREALNRGIAVLDAGHVATERPGMARLYSSVSTMFENCHDFTHFDPTPWERG